MEKEQEEVKNIELEALKVEVQDLRKLVSRLYSVSFGETI